MWAGQRTGKGKGQRDRVGKTSIRTESFRARVNDLDPIRVSPYGPPACDLPHGEAGHTPAPDRMHRANQKLLASTGASTHVRPSRGVVRPAGEVRVSSRLCKPLAVRFPDRAPGYRIPHTVLLHSTLTVRARDGRNHAYKGGEPCQLPSPPSRSPLYPAVGIASSRSRERSSIADLPESTFRHCRITCRWRSQLRCAPNEFPSEPL